MNLAFASCVELVCFSWRPSSSCFAVFSEAGVEAVFDHRRFLAVVVSNWGRLVGLFESGPSVVGDENWRFVVDHLLLYAFHLAPAIFVLALVLRGLFEAGVSREEGRLVQLAFL